MTLLDDLLADLDAETTQLQRVVDDAGDDGWTTATPAPGWTVATQVAHLVWTDEVAVVAATDQVAWDAVVLQAIDDPEGFVDAGAHELARIPRDACTTARWWPAPSPPQRAARLPRGPEDAVVRAADVARVDGDRAVHGDLGARPRRPRRARRRARAVTDRIKHVAHLGVRTRGYAFVTHGLDAARRGVRVS